MAFKLQLTQQQRDEIDAEHREVLRLYGLGSRWLARVVLQMARALRALDVRWGPYDIVYDSALFWHLVPELAYRLGEWRFEPYERTDAEIVHLDDSAFRTRCVNAWRNTSRGRFDTTGRLFFREVANGNPLLFALDRLVAPGTDDWAAYRLVEIARYRRVECPDRVWHPALCDEAQSQARRDAR